MEYNPDDYKKPLKKLLEIVNDGKEGYKHAAEQVHSGKLKELFEGYAAERSEMAEKLKAKIGSDEKLDKDGDTKGAFHRTLMSIKTALAKDEKDDRVILESCREGDRSALDAFDDVLQGTILETDLKPFLTGLRYQISKAFNEVDRLYFEGFKKEE